MSKSVERDGMLHASLLKVERTILEFDEDDNDNHLLWAFFLELADTWR